MQHINISDIRRAFLPVLTTAAAQAAVMTLRAGAASDDQPSNEHPKCEQWLFVLSGTGQAIVGTSRRALRHVALRKNSLLVIEKDEQHQIKNTGNIPLRTINFYIPPAYQPDGKTKAES